MLDGIFQSDLLIRQALITGLTELRRETWLQGHVFEGLLDDPLTQDRYGAKEVKQAVDWFRTTKFHLVMAYDVNTPKFPQVNIHLVESAEEENSLADVDPDVTEVDGTDWPAITDPFSPAWDPVTGKVTLPDTVTIIPAAGMFLVTREGVATEVLRTDEDALYITPKSNLDLRGCVLKGAYPSRRISREGAAFRETYQLTLRVAGEPVHLTYLYSVVMFILLRGRQDLLEARGFGESSIQAGPPQVDTSFEATPVWERVISLSGRVWNKWPKRRTLIPAALDVHVHVAEELDETTPAYEVDASALWEPETQI